MRRAATFAVVVWLALIFVRGAAAGPVRITLLPAVHVDSSTILLADLLPRNASEHVRDEAREIFLGAAPQPGVERRITRATVAEAIVAGGLEPSWFVIPADVTVRRDAQEISPQEIFAAIQSAVASNPGLPNLAGLRPSDLQLDSIVLAPSGYAGLEVTQAAFDPLLSRVRFRLLPKASERVLPFYVTARVPASFPEGAPQSGELGRANTALLARRLKPTPLNAPPLVATGHMARLHLHSADMDMLLAVTPLQRGYLDQVIRVRLAGKGTTMQARVVGTGYLDATL